MTAEPTAAPTPEPAYPLRFGVDYPESLNRWLNNPFLLWIKWLLAIPHLLIVYALAAVVQVITLIAFFAILFTRKYPRGLFDFAVNIIRWQVNVTAYVGMLRDDYPPFSWDENQYPATFEVDYPEELRRFAPLYKWILAIPNAIVLFVVEIAAFVVWIIAGFVILFTGRFPRGMFDFVVGTLRWSYRLNAYAFYLFTDEYPPFSLK